MASVIAAASTACTKPRLIGGRSPASTAPTSTGSSAGSSSSTPTAPAPKPLPGYALSAGGTMAATGPHFSLQGSVVFTGSPGGYPAGTQVAVKPGIQGVLVPSH